MDLNQILASIDKWNELRQSKDAGAINSYFENGNSFLFETDNFVSGENIFMHVYPGITTAGELKFFLISSEKDTEDQSQTVEGILPYITVCDLEKDGLGAEIAPKDALDRIHNWNVHHTTWINQQVNTVDNIFEAFAIPSADIANNHDLRIYMALKHSGSGYKADLIIFDEFADQKLFDSQYFDMVYPVPPFGPVGPYQKSKFYLLDIS